MKLQADLSSEGAKALFESIWQSTPLMQIIPKPQFAELSSAFKVVSFVPGTHLIKKGEIPEWLGIIMDGSAVIQTDTRNFGKLGIGDMIGFVEISGLETEVPYEYDIISFTYGYIAVISLNDAKLLRKKQPTLVIYFKIIGISNL